MVMTMWLAGDMKAPYGSKGSIAFVHPYSTMTFGWFNLAQTARSRLSFCTMIIKQCIETISKRTLCITSSRLLTAFSTLTATYIMGRPTSGQMEYGTYFFTPIWSLIDKGIVSLIHWSLFGYSNFGSKVRRVWDCDSHVQIAACVFTIHC